VLRLYSVTADAIYEFCHYLPVDPRSGDVYRGVAGDIPNFNLSAPHLQFVNHYRNMQFGWDAAKALAHSHKPFPACGEDYVWRAYLFNCDPHIYYDEDIVGALMLTTPTFGRRREVLHGLFVTKDMTSEEAAHQLGMNVGSVEAYEQLFFNIIDRKRDIALLGEVVYPETRLVEQIKGYFENESLAYLLLRAGYNNGVMEVLHFAGINTNLLHTLANSDSPQRLEALIMSAGYLMARNNIVQPQGFFQAAKGMITAAKVAGTDTKNASPTASIADALMGELITLKQAQATDRVRTYRASQKVLTPVLEVLPA